jgi:hypothetical protein
VDEDELPLESDSEFSAENRSCINFATACWGSWVELVESVDEVVPVEEVELSEVEFALEFGGGEGIEIPIWLNASMMLCINVSFPPESESDSLPETWVSEVVAPLFDCSSKER